tara:strand:- start:136 stop:546 length:411 start_codon:yes stop_codon:yes gene_type:complete
MILHTDGRITHFKDDDLNEDGFIKYEAIKAALGGAALAGHGTKISKVIMYVDDNGIRKGLEFNALATSLYHGESEVVGTVVLTYARTENDEPLNEEQKAEVYKTKHKLVEFVEAMEKLGGATELKWEWNLKNKGEE